VEKKGNKGWRGRWRGRRGGGGLSAAARPVSSSDAVGATSPVEERRESRAEGGTPLEEGERELERAPEGKARRRRPTRGGTPCLRWRRRALSPLVGRSGGAPGSCTGARGEGSGGWGKKKRTGIV